jgi:hypothetical protein
MSRHILTLGVAIAALVFYYWGYQFSGIGLLVIGAATELWFWTRIVGRSTSASGASPFPPEKRHGN